MRHRQGKPPRRGTSVIEAVLVTTIFIMLVMGGLDLSVAVIRLNVLTEAARQGARQAIVHGQMAPSGWNGGPWGPSSYGPVAANSGDPKAQAVAAFLAGMDPSTVNVTYQWPDSSNAVEKRVQVTVTTTWTPLMGFIFGNNSSTLTASSTMLIAH